MEALAGLSLHAGLVGAIATVLNLAVEDHELHAPPVYAFLGVNADADFVFGHEGGRYELATLVGRDAEEVGGLNVPGAGGVADEVDVGGVGFEDLVGGIEVEEVPACLAYDYVARAAEAGAGVVGKGELGGSEVAAPIGLRGELNSSPAER